MNNELLEALNILEQEKNISKELLFSAIEEALKYFQMIPSEL